MSNTTCKGEQAKRDALAAIEARRQVYVRRGRRVMLQKMLDGDGRASADDVREAVKLPPGIDPRCLGSVPGAIAYLKLIRADGFTRSNRPERHASFIQVWRLVDRAAAEKWLRENPDVDVPDSDDGDRGGSQKTLFLTCPLYQ